MGKPLCIYCQMKEATTVDHVPPKCLFPKPRPTTLVTVPACDHCNCGASKDDEDLRAYFAALPESDGDPIGEQLRASTMRAFDRSDGYCIGWFGRTRTISVLDDKGQAVGTKMQFQRDGDRIERVVFRTVRGLHYKMYGQALPVDCPMVMRDRGGFDESDLDPSTEMGAKTRDFLMCLDDAPLITIHPEVFTYKRQFVVGDDSKAVWLLTFLKKHWFLVFVNVHEASLGERR